ncbi:MAG: HU family DNA-binding protein [Balneolaceae bacterium]
MSEKITFKELVEQISKQSEQSRNSANSFIHELVQIIESGLSANGSVSISGFGKFELRWMNERSGRNPQTGEEITIPGQNKVVFKPYKALRENVNRPYAKMKAQILGDAQPSTSIPEQDEPSPDPLEEDIFGENLSEHDSNEENPFIFERSKPEPKKPEEPLFSEPEVPKAKELRPEPQPVNVLSPADEAELAKEVEKNGQMKWAYAASTIVVALALLIVFYLMQNTGEPADMAFESTPDEQIESVQQPQLAMMERVNLPDETGDISGSDSYHINQGETLWSIAEKELGDPFLWPWIYQLNKDSLENPNRILNDTDLTIPSLSNPENLSSDQKEQIALGYLSVYEWSQTHQPDEAKFFLWAVGEFSPDILDQAAQQVDSGDLAFAKIR